MKNPREILLNKHRHASASLDSIREQVLLNSLDSGVVSPRTRPTPEDSPSGWPFRWHLTGLGLAWAAIMFFASSDWSVLSSDKPSQVPSGLITESWRVHQRELANFDGTPVASPPGQPGDQTGSPVHRRRTQAATRIALA
jgi:hypothetical protein